MLVDEVNKILQSELYKYISDEKVKVLGSPIPVEGNQIDWENNSTYHFNFEIGISPEIDVNISKKDKLTYYKMADNKTIDTY